MKTRTVFWLGLGGAVALYLYLNRQQVTGDAQSGVEDVQAALEGWQSVGAGPTWVPILTAAENEYGLPPMLLSRIAYQESRFRPDVITGATASPAGALGLMQLMPQYFTSVQVPLPFSQSDTQAQIGQAAGLLVQLFNHFQDWGLAIAGYNDGQGNIDAFVAGSRAMPAETQNYVSQVLADVPLQTSLPV